MTDLFLQRETLEGAMETLKDTQGMTHCPQDGCQKENMLTSCTDFIF